MADIDAALAFDESTRAELIERIGHRDNVLHLYLGAVGAVYGVSFVDGRLDRRIPPDLRRRAVPAPARHQARDMTTLPPRRVS